MRRFTGRIVKDYIANTNTFDYLKGQLVYVTELDGFEKHYVIYHNSKEDNDIDWIPKKFVELI